jgi:DNA-binding MarR family transcriptional regulator
MEAPGTRHPARRAAPDSPLTDLGCACATARQVARSLTQLYDGWLRDTGVEAPQFALLMTLEKEGALSQAAIGRRYALDKTTVSRNLKLLERRGWIQSSAGTDKRERRFSLTPSGRKRLVAARPKWMKAQAALRTQMGAKAWTTMFHAFRTAADAAGRAGGAPAI